MAVPLLLATLDAHAQGPADLPGGAPTPVLELAERDLGATRAARVAMVAALTGPGLLLVGDVAATSFVGTGTPAEYAGIGLVVVGGLATLLGPPALLFEGHRSARALRRQGLDVRSTAALLGVPLFAGTLASVALLAGTNEERPERFQAPQATAVGFYSGAVAMGALQLRTNHLARRDAGWLGLAPYGEGEVRGLAVVGRW